MDSTGREWRRSATPWLVWFLVAFSLNAVLDLGFDLAWWVRWAIVLGTVPLAVLVWNGSRRP